MGNAPTAAFGVCVLGIFVIIVRSVFVGYGCNVDRLCGRQMRSGPGPLVLCRGMPLVLDPVVSSDCHKAKGSAVAVHRLGATPAGRGGSGSRRDKA